MIMLRILRWGGHPVSSRWALNAITYILKRGKQKETWHRTEKDHVTEQRDTEGEGVTPLFLKMEEWDMSQTIQGMQF